MIAALPDAERPRERLWSLGPAALTSVELLAILVNDGDTNARERSGRSLSLLRRRDVVLLRAEA